MPNTRITKERVSNHMQYAKKLYIIAVIVAVAAASLLFDVTRHTPTGEQLMQIGLVATYCDTEKLDDTIPELLARAQERDERIEELSFLSIAYSGDSSSDYYGAQLYMVQVAAGDNDILIQNEALTKQLAGEAAIAALDELEGYDEFVKQHPGVEFMWCDDPAFKSGDETEEAPKHAYAVDVSSLLEFNSRGAYDIRGMYASVFCATTDREAAFATVCDLFDLFTPAEEKTDG